MPIYEYRCEDCGTRFEKLVRRSEEVRDCPSCGQTRVRQEFSVFATRAAAKQRDLPPCAGGRCPTPEACGLNN